MLFRKEHPRSSIACSSAEGLQQGAALEFSFDVAVFVKQDILNLEVPMSDTFLVYVCDSET